MATGPLVSKTQSTLHREPSRKTTKDDIREIRHASKEALIGTAALVVDGKIEGSNLFDSTVEDRIPKFEKHEMRLGRILGRGGFCVVTEIEKVNITGVSPRGSSIGSSSFMSLFKGQPSEMELVSNPGSDFGEQEMLPSKAKNFPRESLSRVSIAQLARKKNRKGGRFALKRVSPELASVNKMTYLKGIVDLAMEAKFLSALDHPNIITLCGVSKHGASDFIIVERLRETLSTKFKTWMKIDRQCKGLTGVLTGSKRKQMDLYTSRICGSHDIASATNYLHSQNVIFRDLKPDNIGFDAQGQLKIFDFGLAKELLDKDKLKDGLYKLTGMTGAMRYMAPEVALGKPYNLTADVYSWSMIMWFILALEPPFGFYTEDMIQDRVHKRGSRPAIFVSWSEALGDIMKRAWDTEISERPNFSEICSVLRSEMAEADGTGTSTMSAISGEPLE